MVFQIALPLLFFFSVDFLFQYVFCSYGISRADMSLLRSCLICIINSILLIILAAMVLYDYDYSSYQERLLQTKSTNTAYVLSYMCVGYCIWDFIRLVRFSDLKTIMLFTIHHLFMCGMYFAVSTGQLFYYGLIQLFTEATNIPLSLLQGFTIIAQNTKHTKQYKTVQFCIGCLLWILYLIIRIPMQPYVLYNVYTDIQDAKNDHFKYISSPILFSLLTLATMILMIMNFVWFYQISHRLISKMKEL